MPGFSHLGLRDQMSPIIYMEDCGMTRKSPANKFSYTYTWKMESWKWREGSEERQTRILQNSANQERVSQNCKA
jgi:hypothetical protein